MRQFCCLSVRDAVAHIALLYLFTGFPCFFAGFDKDALSLVLGIFSGSAALICGAVCALTISSHKSFPRISNEAFYITIATTLICAFAPFYSLYAGRRLAAILTLPSFVQGPPAVLIMWSFMHISLAGGDGTEKMNACEVAESVARKAAFKHMLSHRSFTGEFKRGNTSYGATSVVRRDTRPFKEAEFEEAIASSDDEYSSYDSFPHLLQKATKSYSAQISPKGGLSGQISPAISAGSAPLLENDMLDIEDQKYEKSSSLLDRINQAK